MEFLLAVKEILDAKAVNLRDKDCDKKILKAYTKLMQSETDVLQLQEYKNIIHPLCGNVSLFYEIYSAYNVSLANNDQFFALEKTIENIADKLDKNNISCFSYSYFMYAILSYIASKDSAVNNLRIDSVRWINPEDYNYGYNVKMSTDEITFGQGRYRDRLGDFEIDSGKLLKYKGKNTYVIIPSFVNALGKDAFRDNKNVRLVYIPNTVTTIEKNAFSGCENIETVGLSKNVTSLPDGAFRGCTLLKRINCDNLISIGDDCFFDCKKFRGARFSSLESVGARAFAGCESIDWGDHAPEVVTTAVWG